MCLILKVGGNIVKSYLIYKKVEQISNGMMFYIK